MTLFRDTLNLYVSKYDGSLCFSVSWRIVRQKFEERLLVLVSTFSEIFGRWTGQIAYVIDFWTILNHGATWLKNLFPLAQDTKSESRNLCGLIENHCTEVVFEPVIATCMNINRSNAGGRINFIHISVSSHYWWENQLARGKCDYDKLSSITAMDYIPFTSPSLPFHSRYPLFEVMKRFKVITSEVLNSW